MLSRIARENAGRHRGLMTNIPFLQLLTNTGGSWVIYLLFALSVLAVAVIFERTVIISRQYSFQNKTLPSLITKLD